jgi:5-methylcytosine-specific restriction enzyme subunit McrC
MIPLELTEYEPTIGVELTVSERDDLARLVPSMRIASEAGTTGRYTLTPGSVIGAATVSGRPIVIAPKVPISNVLFLLAYQLDPAIWPDLPFSFEPSDSLTDVLARGFATATRHATMRGLLMGYRTTDEALNRVRGRIRVEDQARRRLGLLPPIEVRYDDYTDDILPNQLLKAATRTLERLPLRGEAVRRSLRSFALVLRDISDLDFMPSAVPTVNYDRLTEHYRPAVELARLILAHTSYGPALGSIQSEAILFDMNDVFENFVALALREALQLTPTEFPQNCRGRRLRLDTANVVDLEPDLSWWQAGRCIFVGDVKYKAVNIRGFKHPDLYQLLAYVVAADLPGGLLVYAQGEGDARRHTVRWLDRTLDVRHLNLDDTPQRILEQIEELAGAVRALAAAGRTRVSAGAQAAS